MKLIQTQTLSSTASSVTFSGIANTFTDLVITVSARDTAGSQGIAVYARFNGDTGSNYTSRYLYGSGTAAGGGNNAAGAFMYSLGYYDASTETANTFGNAQIYIANYAGSTYKTVSVEGVEENNGSNAYQGITAGTWASTAAINSVTLYASTSFAVGSTFSLYGVTNSGLTAPTVKATGGTIYQTANNVYHVFTASGTFTPTQALTADILVVAGGGGTSFSDNVGGGGAGGLVGFTAQALTTTGYAVTIGAGGAGSGNQFNLGGNGANSQFGALTAAIGGGAGSATNSNAASGGSGGGGGGYSGHTGGSGTAGQGNAGYTVPSNTTLGGGGGGAGGAGTASGGGVGSSAYSTWGLLTGTGQNVSGTAYFAGGGGGALYAAGYGGPGGYGGGGQGSGSGANSSIGNGYANTGGGAGGGWDTSKSGGSGIVIVRY